MLQKKETGPKHAFSNKYTTIIGQNDNLMNNQHHLNISLKLQILYLPHIFGLVSFFATVSINLKLEKSLSKTAKFSDVNHQINRLSM